jgi:predicted nucleic acid-binding protein
MVAMDACPIINLANAGVLERVVLINAHRLAVSPAVVRECNSGAAANIINLHADNLMDFVDIDDVPADRLLELIELYGLGDGESESIAVAEAFGCLICSDDRKARQAAIEVLGQDAVIGSLRLLRWCVDEQVLTSGEAWDAYHEMRDAGGFLPDLPGDFFD